MVFHVESLRLVDELWGNASFAVDVVLMILRPRSFVLLGFVQLVLAELVLKQLPSLLDRS